MVDPGTPKQPIATDTMEDISTPQSFQPTDIPSDVSPATSSVSGASATPSVTRHHGRPHKALSRTDYLDFPINGTPEKQEHWFKVKNTRNWRYNVLTSENESAYCERERERTSKYYYDKKALQGSSRCSSRSNITPTNSQGSSEKDDLDGIEYLDVDDSGQTKAQEQSRIRLELICKISTNLIIPYMCKFNCKCNKIWANNI